MNIKLKVAIIEKFGKQVDFANAIGITEPLLSRIVNERVNPEGCLKETIARKLGKTEREIFSGE
jgi:DNA-binding XRE family transcriptional regulator